MPASLAHVTLLLAAASQLVAGVPQQGLPPLAPHHLRGSSSLWDVIPPEWYRDLPLTGEEFVTVTLDQLETEGDDEQLGKENSGSLDDAITVASVAPESDASTESSPHRGRVANSNDGQDFTDSLAQSWLYLAWLGDNDFESVALELIRSSEEQIEAEGIYDLIAQHVMVAKNDPSRLSKILKALTEKDVAPHHAAELIARLEAWLLEQPLSTEDWNLILRALARGGKVQEAWALLQKMEQQTEGSNGAEGEAADALLPSPDENTYAWLIKATAEVVGVAEARAVVNTAMETIGGGARSYLQTLRALRLGSGVSGIEFAKSMLHKVEHRHTTRLTLMTYNALMAAYIKEGRMKEAFSLLGPLRWRGIRPNHYTFHILMTGCLQSGPSGLQQCRHLMRFMTRLQLQPSIAHYNVVIKGYMETGQPKRAVDLAQSIRHRMGYAWDRHTFGYVILAMCLMGKVKMALWFLGRMRQEGFRPSKDHYSTLFMHLAAEGYYQDACKVFDKVLAMRGEDDILSFNLMISMHMKRKNFAEADTLLLRLTEHGLQPDVFTYAILVTGYCRERMWETALEFEAPLRELWQRLELTSTDEALVEAERDKAVAQLRDARSVLYWSQAFNELIQAAEEEQQHSRAIDLAEFLLKRGLDIDRLQYGHIVKQADPDAQIVSEIGRNAASTMPPGAASDDEDTRKLRRQQEQRRAWLRWSPPPPHPAKTSADRSTGEIPPYAICASFGKSWLGGAQEIVDKSTSSREIAERLLSVSNEFVTVEDCFRVLHDFHHATVRRRGMLTLTLHRYTRDWEVIVRSTPETLTSLHELIASFGHPWDHNAPVYVFTRAAACSFDALVALLALAACQPQRVLLLGCNEMASHMANLRSECTERGGEALWHGFASLLGGLSKAMTINDRILLVSGVAASWPASPQAFEKFLRSMISGDPSSPSSSDTHQLLLAHKGSGDGGKDAEEFQRSNASSLLQWRGSSGTPSTEWRLWLRSQGLQSIVRCSGTVVRLDGVEHAPAVSQAELFRIRVLQKTNKTRVDLWLEDDLVAFDT